MASSATTPRRTPSPPSTFLISSAPSPDRALCNPLIRMTNMRYLATLVVAAAAVLATNATAEPAYWVLKPVPILRASGNTGTPAPRPAEIALAPAQLPEGKRGKAYIFDFRAVTSIQGAGQDWGAVTWSLGDGMLPTGLSLSNDGKLAGTPTVKTALAGSEFTVVGSYKGATGPQVYTIKVGDALLEVTSIAAAYGSHTCAVTKTGGAKCWGNNSIGQLGNGSNTSSPIPVDVAGLQSGVAVVATGTNHTCAVTTAGAVKCWGNNTSGQLGNNSTTASAVPVDVLGLSSGVSDVGAGGAHACALTVAGGVQCWGSNTQGQLGDNGGTSRGVPGAVQGLSAGVASLAVGNGHNCATTTAGTSMCWGAGAAGQLGNGGAANSPVPVEVQDGSGNSMAFVSISAGATHTCGLADGGTALCWGSNASGQLGTNSTSNSSVPVTVQGLGSARVIRAGGGHTCAITSGNAAKCWGSSTNGQLGDGSTNQSLVPVNVAGLASGAASIAVGNFHTCAVLFAGGARCWGNNGGGRLGNNSGTHSSVPVDVLE
ncbi:putative Ig domain-containing protein [Acidovorax sp.]|uniref:RCC1 domain-containing protein n=1 Tax=Acidovorax sp. TaxID=1872122 RepID=UPI00391F0D7A